MPSTSVVDEAVQAALDQRFGKAKWILNTSAEAMYLDHELMRQKKLDSVGVERVAADAARSVPHVARVFTREQLMADRAMGDAIGRRVQNGYHPGRGADLVIILEPYWIYTAKDAPWERHTARRTTTTRTCR